MANFAVSIAIFLRLLESETTDNGRSTYVKATEERKIKEIQPNANETFYGATDGLISSYNMLNRKKRELESFEPVCDTKVNKVAPRFGEDYYGENKTIVNGNTHIEELNKFTQLVDFILCQGENLQLGSEFELTCEQRYTFVQLLVIGESS